MTLLKKVMIFASPEYNTDLECNQKMWRLKIPSEWHCDDVVFS